MALADPGEGGVVQTKVQNYFGVKFTGNALFFYFVRVCMCVCVGGGGWGGVGGWVGGGGDV